MERVNRQRLLMVSGSYPEMPCGVAGHVRLVAERLAARGDFETAVLTSADPRVRVELARGYEVRPRVRGWRWGDAGAILEEIMRWRPEVVHIQNPTMAYRRWRSLTPGRVARGLKRRAPEVRIAVMQHDIAVSEPVLRWRYWPLLQAADAVCVSNSRDEQAVLALGVAAEKVYRTPVGSHLTVRGRSAEARAAGRSRLGLAEEGACAAYFGFVQPVRRLEVLVEALAALRGRGQPVQGLILGGPFPGAERYYDRCQRRAQELGLGEGIRWTGYATAEQVADGLAAADVFVSLPRRGADMRNSSILTAIGAELPVITTRNKRYYVDEELEGLGCVVVGGGDALELADAIERLLEAPPTAQELSRRAAAVDPERIWTEHIEMTVRACRGER